MKNNTTKEIRVKKFMSNNKMDSLYDALLHKYGIISFTGGNWGIIKFPPISYLSNWYMFHNRFFSTKEKLRDYIKKEMIALWFKDAPKGKKVIISTNLILDTDTNSAKGIKDIAPLYFCVRCEMPCEERDREGNCRNCNPDAFISRDKAKQERKENIKRGEKWEETKKVNSIEKRKFFEKMNITDVIINSGNNSLDVMSSIWKTKQIVITEELDETFRRVVGVPFTKMRDWAKIVDSSKEKEEITSNYENFLYLVLNEDIKIINEYGCSIYIDWNNRIQYAPLLNSGVRDTEYIIIDNPQDQKFLDLINEKCGTNYKMSDF